MFTNVLTHLLCTIVILSRSVTANDMFDFSLVNDIGVNRSDVIGAYEVDNIHMCQRLCWYRKMCSSYSYCKVCAGSLNCLLHSQLVQDGNSATAPHPDWKEYSARAPDGRYSSCLSRPCGSKHFCLPTPSGAHRCLDNPAQCRKVTADPHGVLANGTAVFQGDVNRVTCPQYFVISPRNASMEVECQANSRWTTPRGRCMQTEFIELSGSISASFPWALDAGWAMCFRGVFSGEQAVTSRFAPWGCKYGECDFPFRLVIRRPTNNPGSTEVLWNRMVEGSIHSTFLSPRYVPLQPGQAFTCSIKLSEDTLSVRLYGHANYSISTDAMTAGGVGLSMWDVTHVSVLGGVTYVNLIEDCTEE